MFSVIIPLYNKAQTIEHTLASVLTQTFTAFEVLIVDDGSTDDSVNIIHRFTSDPRIKIIHQENQGVSVARNTGVKNAQYEYLAFLDGDDEWLPTFLEKVNEAIQQYPEAGMYGTPSWHRNFQTGNAKASTLERYKNKIQLVDFFENPGVMPHTSAMVVSKKAFFAIDENGNGFPVGMKCCEDWSCFYRIAYTSKMVYIGFPLAVRNNNIAGQITRSSADERFLLLKHVVDFYNLTYTYWNSCKNKNKNYPVFLKYDIRGRILSLLKQKDYKSINYIINNLDKGYLSHLSNFEIWLYQQAWLKKIAMYFIYFTKLIWRTNGFPIVGKNK